MKELKTYLLYAVAVISCALISHAFHVSFDTLLIGLCLYELVSIGNKLTPRL